MDETDESVNADRMERLEDPDTFRYLSGEELRALLNPAPDWTVADLGSGTGLYTAELAPVVETLYAVDIRQQMHERYRSNGIAENVELLTADMAALPFSRNKLDGAVSTRTFHHGLDESLDEVARSMRPGGRLVIVDWSSTGAGEREKGRDEEYFDPVTVQSLLLEAGFTIQLARERRETFVVVASAP